MIEVELYYETVYHRNDWTLADAFRPQPGWGCRRFATPASAFDGVTEQALIEGAKGAAPKGYRLTKLSLCSDTLPATPERVIWSASADARFSKVSDLATRAKLQAQGPA